MRIKCAASQRGSWTQCAPVTVIDPRACNGLALSGLYFPCFSLSHILRVIASRGTAQTTFLPLLPTFLPHKKAKSTHKQHYETQNKGNFKLHNMFPCFMIGSKHKAWQRRLIKTIGSILYLDAKKPVDRITRPTTQGAFGNSACLNAIDGAAVNGW